MSNTISLSIADDVADTLFIPLLLRSLESQRPDAIIRDPMACRLVESIDYDFAKYGKSNRSQVGTAIRVRCFDNAVSRFVETRSDPVVVQIGAGLDTRYHRVFKGKGMFYELDLPEVIDARRRLLPESESNPCIACSLFETSWMDRITDAHPGASFILVAEGVFMYFKEEELKPVFGEIGRRFPQGELHFDVSSGWAVRNGGKHDTVSKSRASFNWGLDDDRLPETWSPNLRYMNTSMYMDKERRRWGMLGVAAFLVPAMRKAFRMLHYGIAG